MRQAIQVTELPWPNPFDWKAQWRALQIEARWAAQPPYLSSIRTNDTQHLIMAVKLSGSWLFYVRLFNSVALESLFSISDSTQIASPKELGKIFIVDTKARKFRPIYLEEYFHNLSKIQARNDSTGLFQSKHKATFPLRLHNLGF